jgi:hypothetical protein
MSFVADSTRVGSGQGVTNYAKRSDATEVSVPIVDGRAESRESGLSDGARILLAKDPTKFWLEPEGSDGYPTLNEPVVRPASLPVIPHVTTAVQMPPPSEGLKHFIALPDDFFTNPDYS